MKKLIIIIIGFLFLIVLIAMVYEWVYLKTTTKEEVYIFPINFKGVVVLAYNQKDGLEDIIEDGKLIYKIPQSGILKLKRNEATTISQSWYYFEDTLGKRTEFNYCFPPCDEMKGNPLKFFAFGRSNGASIQGDYQLRRTIFLVGTCQDTDSLNRAYEKLNVIELIKNIK